MSKCPQLIITCPHGKEDRAIEEVLNVLIVKDVNAICFKTKYPGVLMAFTNLDPIIAANLIFKSPTSFIFRITPIFKCVKADMNSIVRVCTELAGKYMVSNCKFYVDCTRRGRTVSSSVEVERRVGDAIVKLLNCKVDFESPDYIVKIEVIDNTAGISILKKSELFKKKARPR